MSLVVGGVLVAVTACSSLLDVKNPNDVAESALDNPAGAAAIANGSLAATVRMLSGTTVPYSVATDELDWIGSRDAWNDLETGGIANYLNEFTDQAFPFVGEARYVADNAIVKLKAFDAAGTLTDRTNLARVYLYGAVIYASIADMYDDFAFSNKTIAKAPIGRAAMAALYDTSISYLNQANTIANSASGASFTALRYPILAYRARVKYQKAVWTKLTPKGAAVPAQPLVSDAGANGDAVAAMAVAGTTADQKFNLVNNLEATAGINIWFEVNGRNEHRTGSAYRALDDPLTAAADTDATAKASLAAFAAFGTQSGTLWITSNRELRLILAESELLACGAVVLCPNFDTQINTVRGLDSKTAFAGQISNLAMLQHERKTQLWLMRNRLFDMHRFGFKDPKWVANPNFESTFNVIGLLFPIPNVERLGNPCVTTPTGTGC